MNLELSPSRLIKSTENLSSFSPIEILKKIAEAKATGCLVVSHNSVTWRIYVHLGKLIYAHHSLDAFTRLERHLRRLSYTIPSLTGVVRNQARLNFENEGHNIDYFPSEYQAIIWLVEENYLQATQAAGVIKTLNKEVLESFLLLEIAQNEFIQKTELVPRLIELDVKNFLSECRQVIDSWKTLSPTIISPEQRPYFFSQNQEAGKIPAEQVKKLSKLLRGFSFRQLAVLTNQDEWQIAQYLYPFIVNKMVVLRDPQPPFDKLPKLPSTTLPTQNKPKPILEQNTVPQLSNSSISSKTYKLICIDDSPTILKEICRFLEQKNLSIKTVNDSRKALLKIIRFKPDIILLDVGMPGIDGYKLCQLIRNHPLFQNTPIIMVTGNRSLIDRAKARVAGASDYLTKPFSQSDLVNIVFRYLT